MDAHAIPATGSAWPASLTAAGLGLADLGAAYLLLLISALAALAAFVAARRLLVISPNRGTREYGLYVAAVLTALVAATVLDNVLSPGPPVLPYAALPQLVILLAVHLAICQRQEPWRIALGAASVSGTILALGAANLAGAEVRLAPWLAALVLAGLLAMLWVRSIVTRRHYANARSIYVASKESGAAPPAAEGPWLGLPQGLGLVAASAVLALVNGVLRGSSLSAVPAASVLVETLMLLAVTAAVCAIPAAGYWLARRSWMPGLTRIVWLAWLVVGFAFTYGNFLMSLNRA